MSRQALRRLRWRRRGAWQWPTFTAAVVGEALLLHFEPVSGDGADLAAGVLLAGALNLFVLAVLGPLLGSLLRRRRGDLPRPVARDYASTALMLALAAVTVGLGIAHHPAVLDARRAFQAQSDAVRVYVRLHAPAAYRTRIDRADSWRIDTNLYRTCVPGPDPQRRLCLIVDTTIVPPGITVDPNRAPNSTYVGPGAVWPGQG